MCISASLLQTTCVNQNGGKLVSQTVHLHRSLRNTHAYFARVFHSDLNTSMVSRTTRTEHILQSSKHFFCPQEKRATWSKSIDSRCTRIHNFPFSCTSLHLYLCYGDSFWKADQKWPWCSHNLQGYACPSVIVVFISYAYRCPCTCVTGTEDACSCQREFNSVVFTILPSDF